MTSARRMDSGIEPLARMVSVHQLIARSRSTEPRVWWGVADRAVARLARVLRTRAQPGDPYWPLGLALLPLNAGAAGIEHTERTLRQLLDEDNGWRFRDMRLSQGLLAYHALGLAQHFDRPLYRRAADAFAEFVARHPRMTDGCLPYVASRRELLVDTLGLLAPFLARYGRMTGQRRFTDLALLHLAAFRASALDHRSGLPFHGYYADTGYSIGIPGWGRGVGWYLLGVVDTALELDGAAREREALLEHASSMAQLLERLQRRDGHWGWQMTLQGAAPDSSATALIAYALARLHSAAPLSPSLTAMLDRAGGALHEAIDPASGWIRHSSGECAAPGVYSMEFGCNAWALGPATAFFMLSPRTQGRGVAGVPSEGQSRVEQGLPIP